MEDSYSTDSAVKILTNTPNNDCVNNKLQDQSNRWSKIQFIFRGSTFVLIIILSLVNSLFAVTIVAGEPKCLEDKLFFLSEGVNQYFSSNKSLYCALMIITSLVLDCNLIYSCILWYKEGKSLKPFVTLTIVLLFKIIIDFLFNVKYPEGMIYEYPGFPSLSISYRNSSTFFFSLNAAVIFILILVSKENNWKYNFYLGIASLFLFSISAIFFRFHYSVDLYGGLLCAHFSYLISKKPSDYLDRIFPMQQTVSDKR